MIRSMPRMLLLAVAPALLAGCSLFSSAPRPAELVKFTPSAELHVAWRASVGDGGDYVFQPAVAGGSVFAAGADGYVARFEQGKRVWRINTKSRLTAGVGSDGNLALVVNEAGQVIALDAETGEERWRANAGVEVLAPPAIGGGVVVLRASDHRLIGLEAENGQQRWLYQRSTPPLALRSHAGVFIVDEVALVGFPGGKIVAVSLENGGNLWELNVTRPRGATELERVADVAGTPVIGRSEVCAVTYQGRAACFDVSNGNALWARDFSSHVGMDRDARFAVIVDERDSVQALDVYNGATAWRQDALPRRGLSRPLIVGDYVVAGDGEGYVHAFNREDGVFAARARADSSAIVADPRIWADGFVVQSRDGKIVAYEVRR
ncbi:MAG: outer membrane protein assembly factor BamB [Azoarcus sp.]|jgi:outer membrane protein assembly factor BamB|nr:outer membrane protein assembly factor BamB [Azoarcus sp.]